MKAVKTLCHNIGSQFATYQYLYRGDGSKTVRGDPGKDPYANTCGATSSQSATTQAVASSVRNLVDEVSPGTFRMGPGLPGWSWASLLALGFLASRALPVCVFGFGLCGWRWFPGLLLLLRLLGSVAVAVAVDFLSFSFSDTFRMGGITKAIRP